MSSTRTIANAEKFGFFDKKCYIFDRSSDFVLNGFLNYHSNKWPMCNHAILSKKYLYSTTIISWNPTSIDCNIEWENLVGSNQVFREIGKNTYTLITKPRINNKCINKLIINNDTNSLIPITKDIVVVCGIGTSLD